MPKNPQKRQASTTRPPERLSITKDVLLSLNARELRRVHQQVLEILREGETDDLNQDDMVLDYEVRILTKDGVAYVNKGKSPMNSILHQRLIPEAPGRFQTEFMHNVYSPVHAAAFELFDAHNPTQNSVHLLENDQSSEIPGLPGDDLYPTSLGDTP